MVVVGVVEVVVAVAGKVVILGSGRQVARRFECRGGMRGVGLELGVEVGEKVMDPEEEEAVDRLEDEEAADWTESGEFSLRMPGGERFRFRLLVSIVHSVSAILEPRRKPEA